MEDLRFFNSLYGEEFRLHTELCSLTNQRISIVLKDYPRPVVVLPNTRVDIPGGSKIRLAINEQIIVIDCDWYNDRRLIVIPEDNPMFIVFYQLREAINAILGEDSGFHHSVTSLKIYLDVEAWMDWIEFWENRLPMGKAFRKLLRSDSQDLIKLI